MHQTASRMSWMSVTLCVLGVVGLSGRAEATLANQAALKQAYPNAKNVSCKTCHLNAIGKKGELNAYGLALQKSKAPTDAKKLTADEIRKLDAEDSDGDKVPNGKELEAGTNPGDPASF